MSSVPSVPEASAAATAINLQLYRRLVAMILAGHWAEGSRLPSSRKLAADTGVSRSTASLALDRLVSDGWAVSRPRSGHFVAKSAARSAFQPVAGQRLSSTSPEPFELGQGAVDCFPHARWARAQSKVWASQIPQALFEPEAAGDHGLRVALVRHLAVTRGIECDVEDVIIVPSTRAAIAFAVAILGDEIGELAVEDPGYPSAYEAVGAFRIERRPIPIDRDGLRVDDLGADGGGSLAYVTPAAQFPTGVIMSDSRREALQQWCAAGGHWLFEDDYDWDARFDGARPTPPLKVGPAGHRTFYCQSLSRTLFPSLRMGVLVIPARLRKRAQAVRQHGDGPVSLPNQLVLREFIEGGSFAAHLRRLREVYGKRRDAMLALVGPYLGRQFESEVNAAGLRVVLRCGSEDAARFAARLRDNGVLCSTLSELSAGLLADDGIVFGFAAFPPDIIEGFGERIRRAVDAA